MPSTNSEKKKTTVKTKNNSENVISQKVLEEIGALDSKGLKNKTTFIIATVFALVLIIFAIILGFLFFGSGDEKEDNPPVEETSSSAVEVEQSERTLSGKTLEEDQQDAVKSAQDILNMSRDVNGDENTALEKIENKDYSDLSEELKNKIRVGEYGKDNTELEKTAYQSVVALGKQSDQEFAPTTEDGWKDIYIDQDTGIAYVPLSIFSASDTPFYFEMVYYDGDWKLDPYSLVRTISFSSSVNTLMETEGEEAQ